jgi:hypothetical protein
MAAPIIATPTRTRPTSDFKVLAAAAILTIAAAASLVAIQVWSPGLTESRSTAESQYGVGYPLEAGLAGPSRISVFEMHGFAEGYPLHGGLAGASTISANVDQSSFGAGYPLKGGLAGPSRVGATLGQSSFADGYPLQGGLAGPSGADEGR